MKLKPNETITYKRTIDPYQFVRDFNGIIDEMNKGLTKNTMFQVDVTITKIEIIPIKGMEMNKND